MEKIVSLCKRRGFIFPGSEIYGGLANSWDYGPLGVELKNNIKQLWWKKFVHERDDVVGLDAALIMNPKVWEASGHLKEFSDPLVECKKCHERYRAGDVGLVVPKIGLTRMVADACSKCGSREYTPPRRFNLMLKTSLGPLDQYPIILNLGSLYQRKEELNGIQEKNKDQQKELEELEKEIQRLTMIINSSTFYFRPETAQSMFVNFKNILDTTRKTLPFGIAQIGKAFRNEITPGNFIFRTREFEQMEIEYFVRENEWKKWFEYWKDEMMEWMKEIGIDKKHVHAVEVPEGERAHYSKRTIDFEYEFPFGQKELYGLAYRTDFDLKNHFKEAPYKDAHSQADGGEALYPHVVEPTWGVDRSVLAVLCEAYDDSDAERIVLHLKPALAPYQAAVFPLLANKPELVKLAKKIYDDLRKEFSVAWDDRGNIGKRYYAQDEIGTPYCITVDFDSLEKYDVTVRDRDTAKQERISTNELRSYLNKSLFR